MGRGRVADWWERSSFRVDFSRDAVPPPGVFAADTEIEGMPVLGLEDIEQSGIHVGADGGVMPVSFFARPTGTDAWGEVILRLDWGR